MNQVCCKKQDKKSGNTVFRLRVIVSMLLMGILVYAADPVIIKKSLYGFQQLRMVPVFTLIAISMFISSLKWKVLLDAQDNSIGLVKLFRVYVIALFFNNFLPSSIGGDGVRIYMAGKHSGKMFSAAASVVVERSVATVSLSILGLAGYLFAEKKSLFAALMLLFVLIAGIIFTFILVSGWIPGVVRKSKGKIRDTWFLFAEASGGLKDKPAALVKNLLLSIAFQGSVAMVAASVIWGMGLPVPAAADMFFITSASSVLAMVPVGINGYGLRESAYIVLLQPYGFTISSALTVSVLFALFVSVFSIAGGLDWMFLRRKYNITADSLR